MLTEHAELGLQPSLVADDSWTSGALSPVEERPINNVHVKGRHCVSPRVEWTGNASEKAALLCVLKED